MSNLLNKINDIVSTAISLSADNDGPDIIAIVNARNNLPGNMAIHATNLNPAELHEQLMAVFAWTVEMLFTHLKDDAGPESRQRLVRLCAAHFGKAMCRGLAELCQHASLSEENATQLVRDTTDTVQKVVSRFYAEGAL